MSTIIPYSGTEKYIFVSYAHRDAEWVFKVVEQLSAAGCRIWYDAGIVPGTKWSDNIAKHIKKSDGLIAFVSQNYIDSEICMDELNFAKTKKKEYLLVFLEDVELPEGMEMMMSRQQWVSIHGFSRESDFYTMLMKTPMILRCQESPAGGAAVGDRPAEDGGLEETDEYAEQIRKEIKSLHDLLELRPQDETYQYAIAQRYWELGRELCDIGIQKEEAAEAYREAVRVFCGLAEENPYTKEYQTGLEDLCRDLVHDDDYNDILSREEVAKLLWETVRTFFRGVMGDWEIEIDRIEEMAEYKIQGLIWDGVFEKIRDLNSAFGWDRNEDRACLEESNPVEAEKMYRAIIGLNRCLAKKYPKQEDEYSEPILDTYGNFADFLKNMGRREEAESLYREELEIGCRMVKKVEQESGMFLSEYDQACSEQYYMERACHACGGLIGLLKTSDREKEVSELEELRKKFQADSRRLEAIIYS